MTGSKPLRVLMVDHARESGGGEHVLLSLVKTLARRRQITVACPPCSELSKEVQRASIPILPYDLGALSDVRQTGGNADPIRALRDAAQAVRHLRRWIRRTDCDLIHSNTSKDHVIVSLATADRPLPLVWHVHDILAPGRVAAGFRWPLRAVCRARRPHLACVSGSVSSAVQDFASRWRRHVIYNGIDVDAYRLASPVALPPGVSRPLILMAGRLAPWKGQHVLLQALARLQGSRRFHTVFAGDALFGDQGYDRHLRALALSLKVADRVTFLGHTDDMAGWMRAADIVVHASVQPEPFGLVIVEAMAAGVPVIASAAGGAAEIVESGVTGLLIEPDSPIALARALATVLDDAEAAARRVRAAQSDVARRFSVQRMAADFEALYDRLVRAWRA